MNALVLAPLLLAVVLVVSGLAKLRDATWQPEAVTRMGVPEPLAHPLLVKALPWVELALAALLLAPGRWSLLGAVPTTVLMLGYVVVVVRALRTIAHPTCHCFGRLTEGEVTRRTVARNVVFVVLGVVAVVDGWWGDGLLARLTALRADDLGWLIGAAVVAATTWLVLDPPGASPDGTEDDPTVTGSATLAGAASGVDGEDVLDYQRLPIPFGSLTDLDGRTHQLRDLPRRGAVMLVFLSQGCSACAAVISQLPDFQQRLPLLDVRPVLVAATAEQTRATGLVNPLLDEASQTWRLFGGAVPMAVVLGADGLLAAGPVVGSRGVTEMVDDLADELAAASSDLDQGP